MCFRSLNDNKLAGEIPDSFQGLVHLANLYDAIIKTFFIAISLNYLIWSNYLAEIYLITI